MTAIAPKRYLKHYYKTMCSLVDEAVHHECEWGEYAAADLEAGLTWDLDATAEKVHRYVSKHLVLDDYVEKPDWLFEEAVLLTALDYFSSYEPVLVRMETNK